jgi:hypothetical protein
MKDIATIAAELGITPQALNARLRVLGIRPIEVREEGKAGKPKRCLSPEQIAEVSNYGKKQETPDYGDQYDAVESGGLALSAVLQSPMAQEIANIDAELSAFERTLATTIVRRVLSVPPRTLALAAQMLRTETDFFPLSEVFVGLTAPSLPVTTIEVNLGNPLPSDSRQAG